MISVSTLRHNKNIKNIDNNPIKYCYYNNPNPTGSRVKAVRTIRTSGIIVAFSHQVRWVVDYPPSWSLRELSVTLRWSFFGQMSHLHKAVCPHPRRKETSSFDTLLPPRAHSLSGLPCSQQLFPSLPVVMAIPLHSTDISALQLVTVQSQAS